MSLQVLMYPGVTLGTDAWGYFGGFSGVTVTGVTWLSSPHRIYFLPPSGRSSSELQEWFAPVVSVGCNLGQRDKYGMSIVAS